MIKKNPLVSIIITYFRKKKYVSKTLFSILNQTYKNYEIIFVYDDNNKEDLKIIKKLLIGFKKKKIIINNKNLGVAKSRNIAVKHCRGSYIAFIDSDDIWKKEKLNKQISFMINNSYHFSFTSYAVINDDDKVSGYRKVAYDAEYNNLINSNFVGLSTVIVEKKLFSKIKFPNLKTQEDFALWLSLLRKGYKLRHLKTTLSCWRNSKNSLSSNIFQKLNDAFKLFYFYEKKNLISSIYSVLILSYNKLIKK